MRGARRLVLPALLAAALGGCLPGRSTTLASGGGPAPGAGTPVQVIAHRGASAHAPENTLAAFRLARAQGADWFELDCTLSADGAVVVIHDDTLNRTTSGTGPVADRTLAELRALDAGGWFDPSFAGEPLPTLAEALALGDEATGVYVEIKRFPGDEALERELFAQMAGGTALPDPALAAATLERIASSGTRNLDLARAVVAAIRASGGTGRVVVQSFSPVICAVVAIEAPDLRVEMLARVAPGDDAAWRAALAWVRGLDLAGLNLDAAGVTPERVAEIHALGRTVAVWTVDDAREVQRVAAAGVDAVITNRPADVRRWLSELR